LGAGDIPIIQGRGEQDLCGDGAVKGGCFGLYWRSNRRLS
jgi:hypothetical protein